MGIDVVKIMQDMEDDIREKGYKAEDLSFLNKEKIGPDSEEYDFAILCRRIEDAVYERENVLPQSVYCPEQGSFFQKVIRRMVKRWILPMLLETHKYEEESLLGDKYLFRIIREQQKEINELKRKISEK